MIENIDSEMIKQIGILIGFCILSYGVFFVWQKYNFVKKSVGWNFINSLARVKNSLSENDLVLEITSQSGKRIFEPVKQTPIIRYTVRYQGKNVLKSVIYDERAVEYLNGIPVLKCTPNDIRPIDRETGLLVNIPPEILEKLAVDSSKTAEGEEKANKIIKMLIWGLIGAVILFLIGMTYLNQTTAEVQTELMRCTLELGKSVTVIGN
jgi:hypothetical protein